MVCILFNLGWGIPNNLNGNATQIANAVYAHVLNDMPNMLHQPPGVVREVPTIPIGSWTQQFGIEAKDMQASVITSYIGNFDEQLKFLLKFQLDNLGFLHNQVRDRLGECNPNTSRSNPHTAVAAKAC